MLVEMSPSNGGRRGVVACWVSSPSWLTLFARAMSIGRAPETLTRSSKIVWAGDGGIWESMRLMGVEMTGLASAEEAAELARDRRSSGYISRSGLPDVRLDFQRAETVEPMRETRFIDKLLERRFLGE